MKQFVFDPWVQQKIHKYFPDKSILSYTNIIGITIYSKPIQRVVIAFNSFDNFWTSIEKYWKQVGIDREHFKLSQQVEVLNEANPRKITKNEFFDFAILKWLAEQLSSTFKGVVTFNSLINDSFLENRFKKKLANEMSAFEELIKKDFPDREFKFEEKIKVNQGKFIPRDCEVIGYDSMTFIKANLKTDKKSKRLRSQDMGKKLFAGESVEHGAVWIKIIETDLKKCEINNFLNQSIGESIFSDYDDLIYIDLEDVNNFKLWKKPLSKELFKKQVGEANYNEEKPSIPNQTTITEVAC